jgi:hypothetical protein
VVVDFLAAVEVLVRRGLLRFEEAEINLELLSRLKTEIVILVIVKRQSLLLAVQGAIR